MDAIDAFDPSQIFDINPIVVPHFLTPDECERLIAYFHDGIQEAGKLRPAIRNQGEPAEARRIRNNTVCWMEESDKTKWIYDAINSLIQEINRKNYKFQIEKLQPIQLAEYKASDTNDGGFYRSHLDISMRALKSQRKISISVQLSDEKNYDGGDLLMFGDQNEFLMNRENYELNIRQRRELGAAILFPSFIEHEITPVTAGVRYSLVGWMEGPNWI